MNFYGDKGLISAEHPFYVRRLWLANVYRDRRTPSTMTSVDMKIKAQEPKPFEPLLHLNMREPIPYIPPGHRYTLIADSGDFTLKYERYSDLYLSRRRMKRIDAKFIEHLCREIGYGLNQFEG